MEHARNFTEEPRPKPTTQEITQPEGNKVERRDLFQEAMEKRHRIAMQMLAIEKLCMPDIEMEGYPTLESEEVIARIDHIFESSKPLFEQMEREGLFQSLEKIKSAVRSYIFRYILTCQTEKVIKNELESTQIEYNPTNLGIFFFTKHTGKPPKGIVLAERQEGYFVIKCKNEQDYRTFTNEDPNNPQTHSWGKSSKRISFGSLELPIIVMKEPFLDQIIMHERQHFINNSILNTFGQSENSKTVGKIKHPNLSAYVDALPNDGHQNIRALKDELIARVRDGSPSGHCADFFESSLYANLRQVFPEKEQQELKEILSQIQQELMLLFKLVDPNININGIHHGRELLVYHLVDVPLANLPERIRAVRKYYESL